MRSSWYWYGVLLLLAGIWECQCAVKRRTSVSQRKKPSGTKTSPSARKPSVRIHSKPPVLPTIPETNESIPEPMQVEHSIESPLPYDPIRDPQHPRPIQSTDPELELDAAHTLLSLQYHPILPSQDPTSHILQQVIYKLNEFQASRQGQERLREQAQEDMMMARKQANSQAIRGQNKRTSTSKRRTPTRSKKVKTGSHDSVPELIPSTVDDAHMLDSLPITPTQKVILKLPANAIRKALDRAHQYQMNENQKIQMAVDQDDVYIDIMN